MALIHASTMLFGPLLLIVTFQGCWTSSPPRVNCVIINMEYVNCTWNEWIPELNYTFTSRFGLGDNSECPTYLLDRGRVIGCRLPIPKKSDVRFHSLFVELSNGEYKQTLDLKQYVKLDPPYNLSVEWRGPDGDLWLYWNYSAPLLRKCVASVVRYKKASGHWQYSKNITSSSKFSLTDRRRSLQYTFQVRSSIADTCGDSFFWSDWSRPLVWGNNTEDTPKDTPGLQVWHYMMLILAVILLVALAVSLLRCERIKVIFVPMVPDPSRNFHDLFHKYDKNVESWVHISRDLKEAFEPDYKEVVYPVREASPAPQARDATLAPQARDATLAPQARDATLAPQARDATLAPQARDATLAPQGRDATLAPQARDATLAPQGRDATLAPQARDATLAPQARDATLAPQARDATLAPQARDATLAPQGRDATLAPQARDATLAPRARDATLAPQARDASPAAKTYHEQFLVNTNCPVVLLLLYVRTKLGLPESELVDLCDDRGALKLLFLSQQPQECAGRLLPARCSFTVCSVNRNPKGGAYVSITPHVANADPALLETLQTQTDSLERARLRQLRSLEDRKTSGETAAQATPTQLAKMRGRAGLADAPDEEPQRRTGGRRSRN